MYGATFNRLPVLGARLDAHYSRFSGAVTVYRGALQNYNQGLVTFGYRFDTRRSRP